jgi:hypothetical protein
MVSCCVDERTPGGRDRHFATQRRSVCRRRLQRLRRNVATFQLPFANLDLAELFNVSTDTWTKAPPMLVPRSFQTATLLPNGQVLVIGAGKHLIPRELA